MQYLLFSLIVWWSLPEAEETIPRENPNTPRSISSVYPTSSLLFPFFFSFRRAQGDHAQRRRSRNLTDQIPQNKKEMAFTRYLSGSHFFFALTGVAGVINCSPEKKRESSLGSWKHLFIRMMGLRVTLGQYWVVVWSVYKRSGCVYKLYGSVLYHIG